jgi:hypothetical protein
MTTEDAEHRLLAAQPVVSQRLISQGFTIEGPELFPHRVSHPLAAREPIGFRESSEGRSRPAGTHPVGQPGLGILFGVEEGDAILASGETGGNRHVASHPEHRPDATGDDCR